MDKTNESIKMWYISVIIGSEDNTTDRYGYVLSRTIPSAELWYDGKIKKGYKVLETEVKVCPAINMGIVDNPNDPDKYDRTIEFKLGQFKTRKTNK